jgi:hypothetical protein
MNSNGEKQMSVQEAYSMAQKIIAKAKADALSAYNRAFSDFQRKHGFIARREECDYEHHGNSWRHMKTYIAADGASFHECVQYPATEYGLRVEYWSDDALSTITYL